MSASILEHYQTSDDNDLRYMALREHFLSIEEPLDDQLLLDVVSRVLIPALGDPDRTITELVSTQLLPHISEVNALETEACVILPLCKKLLEATSHVHSFPPVLQALKNVLSRLRNPLQTSEPFEKYFETLILLNPRPYMVWETLSLLIEKTLATVSWHVTSVRYRTLYSLALSDGGSAAMVALRTATSRVSPKTVKEAFEENPEITDAQLKLLSHITSEQAAFRLLYPELIGSLLQGGQLTEDAYKTLVNLSVWLLQPVMSEVSNVKTELQNRLFATCYEVLADYAEKMETDSEQEADSEQEDYYKELSADGYGGGIMFENEEEGETEQDADELSPNVFYWLKVLQQIKLQLPQTIASILTSPKFAKIQNWIPIQDERSNQLSLLSHEDENTNRDSLPLKENSAKVATDPSSLTTDSRPNETDSILGEVSTITEASRNAVVRRLCDMLSTEDTDLTNLEMAVDAASTLSRREEMQNTHDLIAELLWPHLKPNKQFIGTIKVGNMKQSIDDGVSFRISCYALLQQLQLSYGSQCRVLEECVERGFKDEATIKEISAALFTSTFTQIWPQIEIRDTVWLCNKLWPRIQERLDKALATKPNDSSTSHQIANWTRGIASLDTVRELVGTALHTSLMPDNDEVNQTL
ncbi:Lag2p LALA0_S05e00650g [Lachancea lanzarotensis]|uniref:LALA0S05e00650g1_1 n=1 Tax=Lachancea lanzarotensis TaxID=1245769 RepID=A0A0C7N9S9_9SACH|nr:uncharacterized protein LALA0_S05e00650g [Lachancea lanzarotensis]CEP62224.1 LALA0S05e00650g1_1 [Lachancea lanzarotensis]